MLWLLPCFNLWVLNNWLFQLFCWFCVLIEFWLFGGWLKVGGFRRWYCLSMLGVGIRRKLSVLGDWMTFWSLLVICIRTGCVLRCVGLYGWLFLGYGCLFGGGDVVMMVFLDLIWVIVRGAFILVVLLCLLLVWFYLLFWVCFAAWLVCGVGCWFVVACCCLFWLYNSVVC